MRVQTEVTCQNAHREFQKAASVKRATAYRELYLHEIVVLDPLTTGPSGFISETEPIFVVRGESHACR